MSTPSPRTDADNPFLVQLVRAKEKNDALREELALEKARAKKLATANTRLRARVVYLEILLPARP